MKQENGMSLLQYFQNVKHVHRNSTEKKLTNYKIEK